MYTKSVPQSAPVCRASVVILRKRSDTNLEIHEVMLNKLGSKARQTSNVQLRTGCTSESTTGGSSVPPIGRRSHTPAVWTPHSQLDNTCGGILSSSAESCSFPLSVGNVCWPGLEAGSLCEVPAVQVGTPTGLELAGRDRDTVDMVWVRPGICEKMIHEEGIRRIGACSTHSRIL